LLTFRGNETSMSFPIAAEMHGKTYGIEMLLITVTRAQGGWSIVRRRAPVVGSTYFAFTDPIVLLSGPYKYFLRYYDRTGRQMLSWGNRADLPARIVLNIDDGGGKAGRGSIELPVLVSMPAACFAASSLPACPTMPQPSQDADLLKLF